MSDASAVARGAVVERVIRFLIWTFGLEPPPDVGAPWMGTYLTGRWSMIEHPNAKLVRHGYDAFTRRPRGAEGVHGARRGLARAGSRSARRRP